MSVVQTPPLLLLSDPRVVIAAERARLVLKPGESLWQAWFGYPLSDVLPES